MADEIRVSCFFSITNPAAGSGIVEIKNVAVESHDQAASLYAAGVFVTSTSNVSIPLGSVATVGLCYFRNLDDTDDILINDVVRLKPGQWLLGWFDDIALEAKSSANTPSLEYKIYNR